MEGLDWFNDREPEDEQEFAVAKVLGIFGQYRGIGEERKTAYKAIILH